ncbi:MAG: hypothetical protein ABIE74_04565 [Pseudomonadota bacterium]
MFLKALPFLSFGTLLAGLWIAFRHQISGPVEAKESIFSWDGESPYALKKAYIKRYLTYPGLFFSVLGGVFGLIFSQIKTSEFNKNEFYYIPICSIVFALLIGYLFQRLFMFLARKKYYLIILNGQKRSYKVIRAVIMANGGATKENPDANFDEHQKELRYNSSKDDLKLMCDILEIEPSENVQDMINRLDKVFNFSKAQQK